jgi:hypothetical protein
MKDPEYKRIGPNDPLPGMDHIGRILAHCDTDDEDKQKISVFQELLNSKIYFSILCFWDGTFDVKIGDASNVWKETANLPAWEDVPIWLEVQALEHFPDSDFSKRRERQVG